MSDAEQRLAEIRAAIDAIDVRLLELLAERAQLGVDAGAAKAELGRPVHDPAREAALLERIAAHGAAPLSAEDLRAIWELLMAATRRAEEHRR
ncbi:MAG: chorismate mutase [Candidatus Limnocylindrus sp.]|jgi:chorismate mutase